MNNQGKAKSYEQLEASVMSPFEPKSEELHWAKRRIEELLEYICEIRSENKIAKMTCPNCNIGKIHLMIHKMCGDCVNQQIVSGKEQNEQFVLKELPRIRKEGRKDKIMEKCKCEDKNTDYHLLHCCNAMNDWQSEFRYLLDRKILSRDEMGYLFSQIKSVIDRETYELKQQIEKYRCSTGWAKAIELEKELERVNRQRTIEQGAWEEAKKYQDLYIQSQKELNDYKEVKNGYSSDGERKKVSS